MLRGGRRRARTAAAGRRMIDGRLRRWRRRARPTAGRTARSSRTLRDCRCGARARRRRGARSEQQLEHEEREQHNTRVPEAAQNLRSTKQNLLHTN